MKRRFNTALPYKISTDPKFLEQICYFELTIAYLKAEWVIGEMVWSASMKRSGVIFAQGGEAYRVQV